MRRDPRDALGTLLADAVAPVLGWPALYKCASLSRAWRGKLAAIRAELRQRATPPKPFGLDGLDEALLFRVAPFLGCERREEYWKTSVYEWACLFRLSPVSRAWNDAIAACARRALLRLMDTTPRAFRPDALLGADLERWHLHMKQQGFPDSKTHDDDGYPWNDRSSSCYGCSTSTYAAPSPSRTTPSPAASSPTCNSSDTRPHRRTATHRTPHRTAPHRLCHAPCRATWHTMHRHVTHHVPRHAPHRAPHLRRWPCCVP